jgi:hypothetical protein
VITSRPVFWSNAYLTTFSKLLIPGLFATTVSNSIVTLAFTFHLVKNILLLIKILNKFAKKKVEDILTAVPNQSNLLSS